MSLFIFIKRVLVCSVLAASVVFPARAFADAPASELFPVQPAGAVSAQEAPLLKANVGEASGETEVKGAAWWRWVAPEDGKIDVETNGSEFDTVLCLFWHSDTSSELREISCNDNRGPFSSASFATALVRSGDEYFIRLTGVKGDHGAYRLAWSFSPVELVANDTPQNAFEIAGDSGQVEAFVAPGGDAWWRWTAPADGQLEVSTAGTEFGPDISIQAVNRDGSPGEYKAGNRGAVYIYDDTRFTCGVRQGEKLFFYLRRSNIDGAQSKRGVVSWNLNALRMIGNDSPANAAQIEGKRGALETGEAVQQAWWRWTAPADGYLVTAMFFAYQQTRLFRAPDPPDGQPKLIAEPNNFTRSKVRAGTDYLIQARLIGQKPDEVLRVEWLFIPRRVDPASLGDAVSIKGAEGYVADKLVSSSKTVWWRWEAPAEQASIRFWPHLAGGGWSSGLLVGVYDKDGNLRHFQAKNSSELEIDVEARAGEVYLIRVNTLGVETKRLSLNWTPAPVPKN
jgi:hypothetical protein